MRFSEFLRATVLSCSASATALATLTVIAIANTFEVTLAVVSVAWWAIATATGLWLGRFRSASAPIARLLATAKTQSTLPALNPAKTLINRLWPLLVSTLAAIVVGFVLPQVAAVATGFALIWALAWRRQVAAVEAIEQRDSARFYVDDTSPLAPMKLTRTPGFGGRFIAVEENGAR